MILIYNMKFNPPPPYVHVGRPSKWGKQRQVDPVRVFSKIEITDTCWLWTASCDRHGYGQIRVGDTEMRAHRVVYEILVGPIPNGMDLDHVRDRGCLHRRCVRPAHLEPVDRRTNLHRGTGDRGSQTHCAHGHPFSIENTYWRKDRPGERICKTCRKLNLRAYAARERRR